MDIGYCVQRLANFQLFRDYIFRGGHGWPKISTRVIKFIFKLEIVSISTDNLMIKE